MEHISSLSGVPYLVRAVTVVADLGELIEKALDKPSPLALAGLLPRVAEVVPVAFDLITHAREVATEFRHLTPEQRDELGRLFAEEFDLENNTVEGIVEKTVAVIDQLYDAFVSARDLYRGARGQHSV